MSPEEYEAYEESMVRDFSEKQLTDEERGELDSQIVDEIQAIIDEQNEIDAILAQNKPIENENIEGNDESGGDGLREGGGEVLPREQLDQTGGTGEVEGKESAGPDIDRTDGVTQESASGEVASKNNATGNNWLDNVPNDGRNYFVYVRFPDENRYRAIDLGNGRTVDRLAFAQWSSGKGYNRLWEYFLLNLLKEFLFKSVTQKGTYSMNMTQTRRINLLFPRPKRRTRTHWTTPSA